MFLSVGLCFVLVVSADVIEVGKSSTTTPTEMHPSYALPKDMEVAQNASDATNMKMVTDQLLREGPFINTSPDNSTVLLMQPILLPTGVALLSGDWISVRSAQTKCFLSSTNECRHTQKDDECDTIMRTSKLGDDNKNKFQLFIREWDQELLVGYIALKDDMGRWLTAATDNSFDSDTLYVNPREDGQPFQEAVHSAFRLFYISQRHGGTNGFFQLYRNWSIDAQGRTEPFFSDESDCDSALWRFGHPDLSEAPKTDLIIEEAERPEHMAPIEETLLNTRFYVSQLETAGSWNMVASSQICNAANITEAIQLVYSFTPMAVVMASTAHMRSIGQSYSLTLKVPEAAALLGPDESFKIDTMWELSVSKGTAKGWWNMTANGLEDKLGICGLQHTKSITDVEVPAYSAGNVRVVARYDYEKALPWTATYKRTFPDGYVSTYQVNGTWTRVQYWDSKTECGMIENSPFGSQADTATPLPISPIAIVYLEGRSICII